MKIKFRKGLIILLGAAVLFSCFILSCEDSMLASADSLDTQDDSVTAQADKSAGSSFSANYCTAHEGIESEDDETAETADVYDLTLQIGSDEREMNFCWYSIDTAEAVVQVAPASKMKKNLFPVREAITITGTTAAVPEVEESTGGPGGTPPGGSPSAESETVDSDTADTESEAEDTENYISNEVCATGLKANTKYVYRVGDGTDFSGVYSFTTGNSHHFSFMLVGDPQIGASRDVESDQAGWQGTVTAAIENFKHTDFILSAGDQIEARSGDEDQYTAFFSAEELTSVPFVSCVGNHDNHELYQYHFNTPNESEEYGVTDAGGNYWFTYGKALFMVLNFNTSSDTSHEAFIEEAIEEAGKDIAWKFVIFHHSIYSSARHAEDTDVQVRRAYLYPVFDAYGIDVVMMGHDHVYSRSYQLLDGEAQTEQKAETIDGTEYVVDPTGTLYITANSASGSKYYDFVETDTAYRAFRWQGYEASYSIVDVTDDTFTITTYETDDDTVIDTYAIRKSGPGHQAPHNNGHHDSHGGHRSNRS